MMTTEKLAELERLLEPHEHVTDATCGICLNAERLAIQLAPDLIASAKDRGRLCLTHQERLAALRVDTACPMCQWLADNHNSRVTELERRAESAERDLAAARAEVEELRQDKARLLSSGIGMIAAERKRQIDAEGWGSEHDDLHDAGELAAAALCYCAAAMRDAEGWDPREVADLYSWPWDWDWWKPGGGPIRNLEKAGALIAAEMDRLQRKEAATSAARKERL